MNFDPESGAESSPLLPSLTHRQRDLVEGSLRIVDRDGVEGLSMRSIANELGLSPMAAYKHFGNQRDLLLEVWRSCMRQLSHELQRSMAAPIADPAERFMMLLRGTVSFAVRHPRRFSLIFTPPLVHEARLEPGLNEDRVGIWVTAGVVLEQARDAGRIRNDLPPEQLLIFAVSVIQGLSLTLLTDRVQTMTALANETAVEGVLTLVYDALRPR